LVWPKRPPVSRFLAQETSERCQSIVAVLWRSLRRSLSSAAPQTEGEDRPAARKTRVRVEENDRPQVATVNGKRRPIFELTEKLSFLLSGAGTTTSRRWPLTGATHRHSSGRHQKSPERLRSGRSLSGWRAEMDQLCGQWTVSKRQSTRDSLELGRVETMPN